MVVSGITESKRGGILQSTEKRVRMIFSVMASPNRIDILRILNSKGPLTYSELKSLAGFKSKKESGKFAYHLRKLLRQSLVALNKSERRYTITNLGKLVLSLARQIEERSIIESGKMYVRTSHESIEELDSHKITQSLVREGGLPLELAQKITEEVENRIYKYQTTYLTGPLIREMVNSVLLENGYEEYRNKLIRLGVPVYDVTQLLGNVSDAEGGIEGLLYKTGQIVFEEHLLTNTLPKDIADFHISGDLHITNPGVWSFLPDAIFVNLKELIDEGFDFGGKFLNVSRLKSTKDLDNLTSVLSMIISLIAKETSSEVILDGLPQLLATHTKSLSSLPEKLSSAFAIASVVSKHSKPATIISFRLQLGTDAKVISAILVAYKNYVKITPVPQIGLVIDYEKGKITDVSTELAEIVMLGGKILCNKGSSSNSGITNVQPKNSNNPSLVLGSISINLPRLALESNKDETYFRARLALLMKPALKSMEDRKKNISDLTKSGLNPILAKHTQYMQRGSISFILNLVGIREAVFTILDYQDTKKGHQVMHKVIETAVDIAKKKGKELGLDVKICMTHSDSSTRFATLDGKKYGKNAILSEMASNSYSEGFLLNASELDPKNESILECNKIAKILNGGLLSRLQIDSSAKSQDVQDIIEKASSLVSSFQPTKTILICSQCGSRDDKMAETCSKCKTPYIH